MTGNETPEQTDLLDAAKELIRDGGADGWTLAELAQETGVELSAVQAEFATEWDVFSTVITRDEKSFETVFEMARGASPGERIVAVFEATVPDFDWTYWIELWSLSLRDERANALRVGLDQRFRGLIEEIVRDGVEAGEFEVSDPARVSLTIATLIDVMATNATLGDSTVRPNYMLDACVTVASELLGAELSLPTREARDG